jgi:hypothetical protein
MLSPVSDYIPPKLGEEWLESETQNDPAHQYKVLGCFADTSVSLMLYSSCANVYRAGEGDCAGAHERSEAGD